MSVSRHGRRQLTSTSPHNHVWISDKLVDDVWKTFIRPCRSRYVCTNTKPLNSTKCDSPLAFASASGIFRQSCRNGPVSRCQLRFGSSIPGPLEAQRRATKRKQMTGMAYEQAAMPNDALISNFNLKSWSPFKPAPLETRMRYEPPSLGSWATSSPNPPASGSWCEPAIVFPDLEKSKLGQKLELEEVEQKVTATMNSATAPADYTLEGDERLEAVPTGPQQHNYGVESKTPVEAVTLEPLEKIALLETNPVTTPNDSMRELSAFKENERTWAHDLQHQTGVQELSKTILAATQGLLEIAAHIDSPAESKIVFSQLRSCLRKSEAPSILTLPHLRLILNYAPGKGNVPADLAQTRPIQHKVFSDLCLLFLDTMAKNDVLVSAMLASTSLMNSVMHALAKCSDPDISCRIAADFCEKASSTPRVEKFSLLFLQAYCFLNSRTGPFHNGVSIHRCLPLAGFVKIFSADAWMQRNISRASMHRLENHTVSESCQHATPVDYWFKTIRLSGFKIAKGDRVFVAKIISLLDQAPLLADAFAPLTKAESCSALLETWVPMNEISAQGKSIYHQRQQTFNQANSLYTGKDIKEWYYAQETPYLNLVSGLRIISPALTQEVLPQILHLLYCLEDFGALAQIANYLTWKGTPIPYHMLLAILQPLHSKQPELASRMIYKDSRPFALLNPEILESMIHGGAPTRRVHYIIQTIMGLENTCTFTGVPPASAVTITKQHSEMLCRAAEAYTKLPGLKAGVPIGPTSLPMRHKFHHIIRIIALYREQPNAMDERLVRSLYHVAVTEPIEASESTTQATPVSPWRLAVANKIASLFGYHEMRSFFTAQAMEHDLRIDIPVAEDGSPIDIPGTEEGLKLHGLSYTEASRLRRSADGQLIEALETYRRRDRNASNNVDQLGESEAYESELDIPAEIDAQRLAEHVSQELAHRRSVRAKSSSQEPSWMDAEPI